MRHGEDKITCKIVGGQSKVDLEALGCWLVGIDHLDGGNAGITRALFGCKSYPLSPRLVTNIQESENDRGDRNR